MASFSVENEAGGSIIDNVSINDCVSENCRSTEWNPEYVRIFAYDIDSSCSPLEPAYLKTEFNYFENERDKQMYEMYDPLQNDVMWCGSVESDANEDKEFYELKERRRSSTSKECSNSMRDMFDGDYFFACDDAILFGDMSETPVDVANEWCVDEVSCHQEAMLSEINDVVIEVGVDEISYKQELVILEKKTDSAKSTEKLEEELIIAAKTLENTEARSSQNRKLLRSLCSTKISYKHFIMFHTPNHQGKYLKPPFTYTVLIAFVLKTSNCKSLEVASIYQQICEYFPFFCTAKGHWRNSVRHNLSFTNWFKKTDWHRNAVKGHEWMLAFEIDNELKRHCVYDYKKLFHCVSKSEVCYLLKSVGLLSVVCGK